MDWVRDGQAAEREISSGDYQAAVLGLGLPLKDGFVPKWPVGNGWQR